MTNNKPRLIMKVLAVKDLKKSINFYRETFDWEIEIEAPVMIQFNTPGGNKLMLYERNSFGFNARQLPEIICENKTSGTELYIHVASLDEIISKLKVVGARQLSGREKRAWGDEVAYFADPDGNVLAVAQIVT